MDKSPDPAVSEAAFKLFRADQVRSGTRLFLNAYFDALKKPVPIMTDESLDNFTARATFDEFGNRGFSYLQDGLADVGQAPLMDDDGYQPRNRSHLLDKDLEQEGLRTLIGLQKRAEDPTATVAITDSEVEAIQTQLEVQMGSGKAAKEILGRGLRKIGLAKYMEDD